MIRTVRTSITTADTADTLMMRLAQLGAELHRRPSRHPTELDWTPQPEEGITYAAKLLKTEAVTLESPRRSHSQQDSSFQPLSGNHI